MANNPLDEVCANCGHRWGEHGAVRDECPGSRSFVPTGRYASDLEDMDPFAMADLSQRSQTDMEKS